MTMQSYTTANGDELLYCGTPDFAHLDQLAQGAGDIWHSGLDQGFKNALPEIMYQTTVFLWYVRDFDGLDVAVSWRINPDGFAVRKRVWDHYDGFSKGFESRDTAALHFGFNALRTGAVVLHVSGLFQADKRSPHIPVRDRYRFFYKSFSPQHALYMLVRRWWNPLEWWGFVGGRSGRVTYTALPAPSLNGTIEGAPKVSYVVPTMNRQEIMVQLLGDLSQQTYLPYEVIVVDATQEGCDRTIYSKNDYPFDLRVVWQEEKGSCRQRNVGIAISRGDYILFGDDDLRLPPEFIANHVRFLQTRKVDAATGLDIRAGNHLENLSDLARREKTYPNRWLSGVSMYMSNSNAIVARQKVLDCIGNDLNYEGGYGEDNDFGLMLIKSGTLLLHNPHALLLHLKPPVGGYRTWGQQAKVTGTARKQLPWELGEPVKRIKPLPAPTVMYYYLKHFDARVVREYRFKAAFNRIFNNGLTKIPLRLLQEPLRQLQYKRAVFYAQRLRDRGAKYE